MSPEAQAVLDWLANAKKNRQDILLRGGVAGEGIALAVAYKAAVAEIKLIGDVMVQIDAVFNKKEIAEQSDSGVTEMPEDKG